MSESTPDPWEFIECGSAGASVWLAPHAIEVMIKSALKGGLCETGGILIGRYGAERWSADIVEATPKPKGSLSGWFWFQRSKHGLADLLEERWRAGLHYLGEWHTHPGGTPTPSVPDVRAMRKISKDDLYHCPSPLLVILGGRAQTGWSISATLFRDGQDIRLSGRRID